MKDKLLKLAHHAYRKVPIYYNSILDKNLDITCWEDVPVVEKNFFINKSDDAVSVEYIMDLLNGNLMMTTTSGSTGEFLKIIKSRTDDINSMLELWIRRKKYYGISTSDKMCYFYMLASEDEKCKDGLYYIKNNNQLGFNKICILEDKISKLYEMMIEHKPKWITIQPSCMRILLEYIKGNNLIPIDSLKYIEFTGENLSSQLRKEVKDYFGCAVANQYGCNEANSIAYECPNGNLHVMSSNVYVEILENGKCLQQGCEGNICITTKNNKVMPFVRYLTGDIGSMDMSTICDCGNCNPILKLKNGRNENMVIGESGRKLNVYPMLNPIEVINDEYSVVKQFQIIQMNCDSFVIRLVLDEEQLEYISHDEIVHMYLELLPYEYTCDTQFQFEFVDKILPDEKTGKVKSFINNTSLN